MLPLERVAQPVAVAVSPRSRTADQGQRQHRCAQTADRPGSAAYGRASPSSTCSAGVRWPLKVALRWERSRHTSTSPWTSGQGS